MPNGFRFNTDNKHFAVIIWRSITIFIYLGLAIDQSEPLPLMLLIFPSTQMLAYFWAMIEGTLSMQDRSYANVDENTLGLFV